MPGPHRLPGLHRSPFPHWLWLALPLAIYLALPTRNYYWDGVAFAINVEKQLPLRETLHPSHLIYAPVHVWLYHLALLIGLHTRALFLMQFVNSLLAGGAVVLVYRTLRRRTTGSELAVAGALAFAFAATWWRFSTDADAYIPSVFLLLCANDLVETRRGAALAGMAHAAAMLFHELAILFLPVALFRLKDRKKAMTHSVCSLGPVAIAYVLAYRIVSGRFRLAGLASWMTAHSPDASFSWNPARDLWLSAAGTVRLIFGGRLEQVRAEPITIAGGVAVLACLVGLAVGWKRSGPIRFRVPPRDLVLWLAIYAVFLFIWMPQNTFYRLFCLAPLVLAACCAAEEGHTARTVPWMLPGILFAWNLAFAIYPQSRVENNPPLAFALAQREHWSPGTPIVFHEFHPDLWTISYFNQQAAWIGFDKLDLSRLDQSLEYARQRGQPLWMEATAYRFLSADPDGRNWLALHPAETLLRFEERKREFRFYVLR